MIIIGNILKEVIIEFIGIKYNGTEPIQPFIKQKITIVLFVIFLEAISLDFVLFTLISKSLSLKSFHKQPKALMPQAPIKKIKYRNISLVILTSFKLIPQIQGKYSNNIPWGLSYRDAKKNFFIIDIFV